MQGKSRGAREVKHSKKGVISWQVRTVDEGTPSVPFVGRLQQDVQEQEFVGTVWEEGQSSAVGAALQRPMEVKASSSWFKEPISEVVGPIVEGVQPIDGRINQPAVNRAIRWFKEPISEIVGPFVEGVWPIEGRAGQPAN